ncbi:hypothetical protein ACYPKM_00040 [Pseudomonas aeruginosa]
MEMIISRQQPAAWGFPVSIAVQQSIQEKLVIANDHTASNEAHNLAELDGLLVPAVKLVVDNAKTATKSRKVKRKKRRPSLKTLQTARFKLEQRYDLKMARITPLAAACAEFVGPNLPLAYGPVTFALIGPQIAPEMLHDRRQHEHNDWIVGRVSFSDADFIGPSLVCMEGPVKPMFVGPMPSPEKALDPFRFLYSAVGTKTFITAHKNPFKKEHWLLLDRPFKTKWYDTKKEARQALAEVMSACGMNFACEAEYLEHKYMIGNREFRMYATSASVGIYCEEKASDSKVECYLQLCRLDDEIKPKAIAALAALQEDHNAWSNYQVQPVHEWLNWPLNRMCIALLIALVVSFYQVVLA